MDYIYSIILAIIQAITEFLPISSSGHLIIVHQLIQSELLNNLTFDVILHFGTLIALLAYFWKDLIKIFKRQGRADNQLGWLIIVSIIPALLVGYFFENFIEQQFRSLPVVIIMLIVGGILFIILEKISSKKRDLTSMTLGDALVIGFFQILAFIPGTSRSGITIVGGLLRGFNRKESARFSFLIAIPIVLIAAIRRITQISLSDSSVNFVFVCILGAIISAVVGFYVIKFLLKFLESRSLTVFAIYRFVLAIILTLIFFLNFN
ncbi:undecaprenyl-diphosphatase UppP [Patescibacteria group bacterium]|nr:undecaprenyl-diphosphatase UppP [Patescibacteria group bacterium]